MLWEGDAGDMVSTAQQYPLKRLGEVEDIAGAALYLAAEHWKQLDNRSGTRLRRRRTNKRQNR